MSDRYATLVTQDDGSVVVSNIAQMEGVPPEVRDGIKKDISVIKVPDGVKIGMVKGGPIDAVGGFGWPKGTPSVKDQPTKETPVAPDPDVKSRADVSKK